jgi:putative transposase
MGFAGWQYQMKQYQYLLQQKGVVQSMSRKGNCLDNAIIENFFGILKSELFYTQKFKSIDDEPDKISNSLLSELIINLSEFLGAV